MYQQVKRTAEVFTHFVEQKKNRAGFVAWCNHVGMWDRHGRYRTGQEDWSVACEGNQLYSFGTHYLLGLRLPRADGTAFFLRNADPWSLTTAHHQAQLWSATLRAKVDGMSTSFEGLAAAGVNPHELSVENVIDWTEDQVTLVAQDRNGRYWRRWLPDRRFSPPSQGMFIPTPAEPGVITAGGEAVPGVWHVLGGLLLQHQERCLLAALDEGRYFVSQLAEPVATVADAFEALKPAPVHRAEQNQQRTFRQGEWFCVQSTLTDGDLRLLLNLPSQRALRQATAVKPLPFRAEESNRHCCRHVVGDKGELLATGIVRHTRPDGTPSGEHAPLRLPEGWWYVFRNTERQSWSVGSEPVEGRQVRARRRFD